MKAITDEKLRDAIDVLCEVSFPHPDQQAAFDTLCNAAHALGILGMRYRRLKDASEELAVSLNRVANLHPDGNPKQVIEEAQTVLEKYRKGKTS